MKKIKNIILLLLVMLTINTVAAQERKPASPPATATGIINGANITIKYSSPSVKGREIWGGLVPYNKIWRAGANNATTFSTNIAIMVEGKELPAGTYAFFVTPQEDGTATVIFNKEAEQWGAYKYKQAEDQLRVKVNTKKSNTMNERLVYNVNKNNVTLSWENWDIPIMIK